MTNIFLTTFSFLLLNIPDRYHLMKLILFHSRSLQRLRVWHKYINSSIAEMRLDFRPRAWSIILLAKQFWTTLSKMSYKSKRKWTLSHLITAPKHLNSEHHPPTPSDRETQKSHRSCIFHAKMMNFCLDLHPLPLFLSLKIQQVLFHILLYSGEKRTCPVCPLIFLLLSHTKFFF